MIGFDGACGHEQSGRGRKDTRKTLCKPIRANVSERVAVAAADLFGGGTRALAFA